MVRLFIFFGLLLFCSGVTTSNAAQSAADVALSTERKGALLKDTIGARAEHIQNQEEYTIGHGDVLSVSIFEEGDMSASSVATTGRQVQSTEAPRADAPRVAESGTRVMMDGRISLREIGDIEVVGLTLAELANYLKKLYATIYENPIVTTALVQSNSMRYTVMGNVTSPGVFLLDYPLNVVQVVAKAGGFSQWASKEITIVRKNLKDEDKETFKENTLMFDYGEFIKGKSLDKNIFIRSGDIIVVN
jgi:polysaccharide biosynthesis/export protein